MKLSNRAYDIMKWIALVALPALQVFWLTIGKIWEIDYTIEIGATIGAVALFIGTLLGVSTKNYYETFTEELTEEEAEEWEENDE